MKEILKGFVESFQILTKTEVDMIVDNANVKSFKKGSVLLKEGQIAQHCYFILKGCIREYYVVDTEEKSTAFYTELDAVTPFSSYTNQTPSKSYFVCAEDCILTVSTQSLEAEMCAKIPRLESIIRQEVEKNTGKTQDELASFITSSPEQRYLNLLETRPSLINRIPQHQLASFIGIKPESLSRIRKRLHTQKGW
jgi:CRP-like cAMP-binding protein